MQAKCLYTHDLWDGSKGENFFFQNMVMLHIKLMGMKCTKTCKQKSAVTHTLDPSYGSKVKTFFSEYDHVVYQIKGNEQQHASK